LSVREADTLKILWLLVHEVDDEGEAAVKMIVKMLRSLMIEITME